MNLEDMQLSRGHRIAVVHAKEVRAYAKKLKDIKSYLRRLGFSERHEWRLEEGAGGVMLSHPELPKPLKLTTHDDGLLDVSQIDCSPYSRGHIRPALNTQELILDALERMQRYDWSYDRGKR